MLDSKNRGEYNYIITIKGDIYMKKSVKFLSVILALIMLLTAVPMQSFASFDLKLNTLVDVEFTKDARPISYKELSQYAKEVGEETMPVHSDLYFDFYFLNGTVLKNVSACPLVGGYLIIIANAYVNVAECMEAFENGKDSVNVIIEILELHFNGEITYTYYTKENKIVKELVKKIRPVNDLPALNTSLYDATKTFVGKKFEVTYADGSKELEVISETIDGYYLGDYPINIYSNDRSYIDKKSGNTTYYTGFTVYYADIVTILNEKKHTPKYSNFEVLDYNLSEDGYLQDLTYRITYKNGKIKEKKCIIEGKYPVSENIVIDTVDGYDIVANIDFGTYASFLTNATATLSVTFAHDEWYLHSFNDIDFTDLCDCNCHKAGPYYIIYAIRSYIITLLDAEEYCRCGVQHIY